MPKIKLMSATMMKTRLHLLWFLATASIVFSSSHEPRTLCVDDEMGAFVGLAIDKDAYHSEAGSVFPGETDPQKWELVDEGTGSAAARGQDDDGKNSSAPVNSYAGRFLQVVPDNGRRYPTNNVHMKSVTELEGDSPYIAFRLRVKKKEDGWHTLFLRWTGGDNVGGSDSLFVVMKGGKKFRDVIPGQRTLKPSVIPIDSEYSSYVGCCYDPVTHACPCLGSEPDNATCPAFFNKESASNLGTKCHVGPGVMEWVYEPKWYEYAGQGVGDVMDFDAEPWDATCEAEGSNTADSGHDFATWNLKPGDYELRIYAREDGTAFDALYLAGPKAEAPKLLRRYREGESTFCPSGGGGGGFSFGWAFLIFTCAFVGFAAFKVRRDGDFYGIGQRFNFFQSRHNRALARDGIMEYAEMQLNPEMIPSAAADI